MAEQNVNRIYSTDNKLWVGMTVNDAYKDRETLDLFLFADKNNDKKIDELEMERYNSPILVENKETKVGRFIGNFDGHTGIFGTAGKTAGEIILDNEREYYAGLKLEHVDEPDAIQRFQELDIAPKDKVLSKKEIELAMLEKEHTDNLAKLNKAKENINKNSTEDKVLAAFIGYLIGGLPGAAITIMIGAINPALAAGGAFIGAVAGYYIEKSGLKSYIKEIDQKIAEENARYEQERQKIMAQND